MYNNHSAQGSALVDELRSIADAELRGSIIIASDGTRMYTPDGVGNYASLWTRDFAYMLIDAGELVPVEDALACVEYLARGMREGDMWAPDRVDASGRARYTASNWDDTGYPLPNLDNNDFLVSAALAARALCVKADAADGAARMDALFDRLAAGFRSVPLDERGLVYNDPAAPHSPYGFTDCVAKTGSLCMESLLHRRAARELESWARELGRDGAPFARTAEAIEKNLEKTFFSGDRTDSGALPSAATVDCGVPDVWAAVYAISSGFPLSDAARDGITGWLASNLGTVSDRGQLRHMPEGVYWPKLYADIPRGEYQNGAFWATATGWAADALAKDRPELARQLVLDAAGDFRENGPFECINGERRKLDHYVASATAVYGAAKRLNKAGIL